MDIKKIIMNEIKNKKMINLEQRLEKCRPLLIKYLSENSLEILQKKIREVYSINSWRKQIIPIEVFLNSVKVVNTGNWSFDLIVDEKELEYITATGEPIYQGYYEGVYENTYGRKVESLNDYWHTPIGGMKENIYYIKNAVKEIMEFIKTDFTKYAVKLLEEK